MFLKNIKIKKTPKNTRTEMGAQQGGVTKVLRPRKSSRPSESNSQSRGAHQSGANCVGGDGASF